MSSSACPQVFEQNPRYQKAGSLLYMPPNAQKALAAIDPALLLAAAAAAVPDGHRVCRDLQGVHAQHCRVTCSVPCQIKPSHTHRGNLEDSASALTVCRLMLYCTGNLLWEGPTGAFVGTWGEGQAGLLCLRTFVNSQLRGRKMCRLNSSESKSLAVHTCVGWVAV